LVALERRKCDWILHKCFAASTDGPLRRPARIVFTRNREQSKAWLSGPAASHGAGDKGPGCDYNVCSAKAGTPASSRAVAEFYPLLQIPFARHHPLRRPLLTHPHQAPSNTQHTTASTRSASAARFSPASPHPPGTPAAAVRTPAAAPVQPPELLPAAPVAGTPSAQILA